MNCKGRSCHLNCDNFHVKCCSIGSEAACSGADSGTVCSISFSAELTHPENIEFVHKQVSQTIETRINSTLSFNHTIFGIISLLIFIIIIL